MNETPEDAAPSTALPPLADLAADAIARAAPSVVAVQAGPRTASGLVWSAARGEFLTTTRLFHRVGARALRVLTHDGEVHDASLVAYDPATELALLRTSATPPGLTEPALIGATGLRVGSFVLPVARTAHGVRATFGVVSGLGGPWVTPRGGAVDAWIDVDASLPPGFSGGPLVDLAGRVVGLNTRGLLRGGATVPTPTLERVGALLAGGRPLARGFLGLGVQSVPLPEPVATTAGQRHALLVTTVYAGSAGEQAGLIPGDTVVAVADTPTRELPDLLGALAGRAGVEVTIRYVRAGVIAETRAVPTERPDPRR